MTTTEPATAGRHPRSVVELLQAEAEAEGRDLAMRFFWGHRPSRERRHRPELPEPVVAGAVHRRGPPLRQHRAVHDGAQGDAVRRRRHRRDILATPDPARVNALGRRVRDYDDSHWQQHRRAIVVAGNTAKFAQDARLRAYLLGTGTDILVEASPVDAIWGIGVAAGDVRARRPATWPGLNLLGFALMDVRATLADRPVIDSSALSTPTEH